jgi:hypothetical protein
MQQRERVIWNMAILLLLDKFVLGDPYCWRLVIGFNPITDENVTVVGFVVWNKDTHITNILTFIPDSEFTTAQKHSWLELEIFVRRIMFTGWLTIADMRNPFLGVNKE